MLTPSARVSRHLPTTAPRPRTRLLSAVASIALACATLVGGAVTASTAALAAGAEDVFTSRINEERATRGVHALTSRDDLVAVARRWAETMAAQAKLYHNPDLTSDVTNWSTVGENVGYGPDALTVHAAFMGSPGHRANILDTDYTEVGVGVVEVDGRVWVAEVFRHPEAPSSTGSGTGGPSGSPSTAGSSFPGVLRYGSRGAAVQKVQRRLGVGASGFYGTRTRRAVARFQRASGLSGTGVVGRRTWNRLF